MTTDIAKKTATLPQSYEDMTTAIALCESVDECKDWADKAAALASYHRQSKDTVHMNHFMRIQARAIRRAGEVLETIEPATGKTKGTGNDTFYSRTEAAQDAGMSKRQQVTAMKIARIPKEEFEEMVESYNPPTITSLSNKLNSTGSFHVSTGENEWYTPSEYIEAARSVMGSIDLDPASSYEANKIVKAGKYFTVDDDGLQQEWCGNVWLNPPYSMPEIERFIDKLISENFTQWIVLTNNSSDTRWYHQLLMASKSICITRGRIGFINNNGEVLAARQGQTFFYYGDEKIIFNTVFSHFGVIMEQSRDH